MKSIVEAPVTSRDSPGCKLLTVDCQVIVWLGVASVSARSKTSVSKSGPGMVCVGATLNEPGTTATPVPLGTCTRAVTGMPGEATIW